MCVSSSAGRREATPTAESLLPHLGFGPSPLHRPLGGCDIPSILGMLQHTPRRQSRSLMLSTSYPAASHQAHPRACTMTPAWFETLAETTPAQLTQHPQTLNGCVELPLARQRTQSDCVVDVGYLAVGPPLCVHLRSSSASNTVDRRCSLPAVRACHRVRRGGAERGDSLARTYPLLAHGPSARGLHAAHATSLSQALCELREACSLPPATTGWNGGAAAATIGGSVRHRTTRGAMWGLQLTAPVPANLWIIYISVAVYALCYQMQVLPDTERAHI
jgi:hypothetical protein